MKKFDKKSRLIREYMKNVGARIFDNINTDNYLNIPSLATSNENGNGFPPYKSKSLRCPSGNLIIIFVKLRISIIQLEYQFLA